MNHEPKLVVAGVFTSVHEALFAKSVLEAAGIEVTLADEHVVSMTWTYSNGVPLGAPLRRRYCRQCGAPAKE